MIGQHAATDPLGRFAETIARLERRVAELERAPSARRAVQAGRASATTDGSGDITVTFPVAFAAAPIVTVTRLSTSTAQVAAHVTARSASSFTVRCTSNDVAQTAASVEVMWIAIEE